jgi:penicillin amidase
MRILRRVATIVGIVLLALVVIVAGAGTWLVRRPWPQTRGTIAVDGLSAPVEVIRDKLSVPNIYAQNQHDLFFAQGYVHAQDRLWQMEFNRRIGSGSLSAIVGDATLGTDRFLRTLGLHRAAEQIWTDYDPGLKAVLEAYAAGVNAYVDTHRNRLPLEFTILGVDPAPWTPVDTITWAGAMSLTLCGNYKEELLRARLIAAVGQAKALELMPPYDPNGPFVVPSASTTGAASFPAEAAPMPPVPPEAQGYTWLQGATFEGLAAVDDLLGKVGTDVGSNNWVIAGSRTATGSPLLANDTHLGLDMPSIWYEIGLHGGGIDSVGYSFPGVPLIIIGHNARIAWGVTNLGADVQDFYIEKLDDPAHPTQYEFEGQWYDLQVLHETIEVKGSDPVPLDVLLTRHGPIMTDVLGTVAGSEPLALRWTALDGNRILQAVLGLNVATNWDEFRQALRYWDAPSQNFVYADVDGNIGYQTPGLIPVRAPGDDGSVPMPGWTGEYEWQGTIPFDELPSTLNPPAGFIVSANNQVVPDSYAYHLTSDWAAPYRARRITDLLAADDSVTMDDIRNIHAQTYSLPAEALRPYLVAIQPEGDLQTKALAQVKAWDLYLEADRTGAPVYEVWYWYLVQNTFRDDLDPDLMDTYLGQSDSHVPAFIALMSQPDSPWFDDKTTPQVETRDDMLRRSLADAVTWLSSKDGDNPDRWTWGRLHTKTFIHQPLGQSGIGLLERLFNSKSIPARGDQFTVDAAWFDYSQPFAMTGGASERYVADLRDLDSSRMIHTTGQSGQIFNRHREDMISLWQDIEYGPMPFSRTAVEAQARDTLTLTP